MQIMTEEKPCIGGVIIFYTVLDIQDGDFKLLKESYPHITEFICTKDGIEFRDFRKQSICKSEVKKKEKENWETEYQSKKYGDKNGKARRT